ncbi:MAG: hypothetical protein ONB42_22530 [candidate division KSB1 bacterium]|nr:hypothetical protein [candidate division KSB1 bacterium]
MNSESSPVRLTIVDFMGVFLPGIVWLILFLSMAELLHPSGWVQDANPRDIAYALVGLHSEKITLPALNAFSYVGLAFVALLAGYFMKAIPSRIADLVSFGIGIVLFFPKTIMGFSKRSAIPPPFQLKDYLFPYPAIHKRQQYFKTLESFIESKVHLPYTDLRGYQPFSICKRLLKIYVPELWEEIQHREAQVRMLDSLLLASLFSFMLSVAKLGIDWYSGTLPSHLATNLIWLTISMVTTIIMAATYRVRRHREVEDVYHYTLIASRLTKERNRQKRIATARFDGEDPISSKEN